MCVSSGTLNDFDPVANYDNKISEAIDKNCSQIY